MKKLLLVIDIQNSFINKNTVFLLKKIQHLIESNSYENVVFTRFINDKNNMCYKKLGYMGCINNKDRKIVIDTKNNKIIDKLTYTALNDEFKEYLKEQSIDEIYLCGIDTECCVLKTALDLFEAKHNVFVLQDYCACTHGKERHSSAIEILKRNIGIDFVI